MIVRSVQRLSVLLAAVLAVLIAGNVIHVDFGGPDRDRENERITYVAQGSEGAILVISYMTTLGLETFELSELRGGAPTWRETVWVDPRAAWLEATSSTGGAVVCVIMQGDQEVARHTAPNQCRAGTPPR